MVPVIAFVVLTMTSNPLHIGDIGPTTVILHNGTDAHIKVFENGNDVLPYAIAELGPGDSKETGWAFPEKPSYRVEDERGNTIYCGPYRSGIDDFDNRMSEGAIDVDIRRQASVKVEVVNSQILCEP